mgnify:CR=1 FL=1
MLTKQQIISVEDGDIIVICSDGVTKSSENQEWLTKFIKNIHAKE